MHCVLCPDRVATRPATCNPCRLWLPRVVGDIRILAEQLAAPEAQVRDVRVAPVRDPDAPAYALRDDAGRLVLRWRDPVAHAHPAGPVPGLNPQPRVAGSHEPPAPINVGAVDLVSRARPGSLRPHARGVLGLDADQIGEVSLATALEAWVLDWRAVRDRSEMQPEPTVRVMTRWLGDRMEWACDGYPELAAFAEQMRLYCSALRRALGVSERHEYKAGVACPRCKLRTLWRRNGQEWIECASCPAMLSPAEYATHVTTLRRASSGSTF